MCSDNIPPQFNCDGLNDGNHKRVKYIRCNDIIQVQRLYDYTSRVNRDHAKIGRHIMFVVAAFTKQYENNN